MFNARSMQFRYDFTHFKLEQFIPLQMQVYQTFAKVSICSTEQFVLIFEYSIEKENIGPLCEEGNKTVACERHSKAVMSKLFSFH